MQPYPRSSDMAESSALVVGAVDAVTPTSIGVVLNTDAPQSMALNTGAPTGFPRVNSYVLIPVEGAAVVGQIDAVTVEASNFPKRTGLKDFGLVDLPFPLRRLKLTPVGTLRARRTSGTDEPIVSLERGVSIFPSVGDLVVLPTPVQVHAILRPVGANPRVSLGTSPVAPDIQISVDPDLLFGQHLAVLGNTGSGKSCTVAGLVRWAMAAAFNGMAADARSPYPNARFIVLDPNGEYARAFADMPVEVRMLQVPPPEADSFALRVPAWLWTGEEWAALTGASPQAQRPLLMQALRELRSMDTRNITAEYSLRRVFDSYRRKLSAMLEEGPTAYAGDFQVRQTVGDLIQVVAKECRNFHRLVKSEAVGHAVLPALAAAAEDADALVAANKSGAYFDSFTAASVTNMLKAVTSVLEEVPASSEEFDQSEDSPVFFNVADIPERLRQIAARTQAGSQTSTFIATLIMRIETMLGDRRVRPLVVPNDSPSISEYIAEFLGNDTRDDRITIIDLSLIPSDIVHLIVAIVSRIVFEATQRHLRVNGSLIPTAMILEEAHRFIRSKSWSGEDESPQMRLCREMFERIAREGRKFGLGLVISSQRPTELSATVLSQCNSYILHRLVNGSDQDAVARVVPDTLGGLLAGLPSLPEGEVILLGAVTAVPVLVRVHRLPEHQRPYSANPDFWDVWTRVKDITPDWAAVQADWIGDRTPTGKTEAENEGDDLVT